MGKWAFLYFTVLFWVVWFGVFGWFFVVVFWEGFFCLFVVGFWFFCFVFLSEKICPVVFITWSSLCITTSQSH